MANSAKSDNTLRIIVLAAIAAMGLAFIVSRMNVPTPGAVKSAAPASGAVATAATATTSTWAASAPGRVEPKSGEIKLSPQSAGRITEVLVSVNDKVKAGDLLIHLESTDIEARLAAAESEVSVRRRERDAEAALPAARERRTLEDTSYSADRALAAARADLDRLWRARTANPPTADADLVKAREAVVAAREKADAARIPLRRAQIADANPGQSRIEAALTAARSDVALAESALERMMIRAPRDGSILQNNAVVGESVAPSPENIVMTIGDMSALRVKAEIEERDIGKVAVGQDAVIKSDAFPNTEMPGKVSAVAQALSPGRVNARGPRKPTDLDVLELTIDLTGQPKLLPGMRVDVFLKPLSK